jgi:TPP-dependent 2-oxoacid decarboxylase
MPNDQPFTISRYLLERIAATGVRHIFGVPGDYNLTFLDQIEAHPVLRWVGNANELNAAYMADGYARVNGLGVVVTTYGVGELSAMNGIAGAYAENVPVLHIVGTPSLDIQRRHLPVHHSLLDGDHGHFLRAAQEVTCAAASLDGGNAATEIDRVIAEILRQKRPGYLALPSDLVSSRCPAPAAVPGPRATGNVEGPARAFADSAARLLGKSTAATVLVDALSGRYGVAQTLNELIAKAGLTVAVTAGGKGIIDESAGTFSGLYIGELSAPDARSAVENADVVIRVGPVDHDLSTGGFTTRIDPSRRIDIHPDHAAVGAVSIAGLSMQQALDELGRLLTTASSHPAALPEPASRIVGDPAAPLNQDTLWRGIGSFLRPGDIVAADQGTSFYALLGQRLPAGVQVISQPGWASIGYTLPAIAGAQLASMPRRRAVLVIGDGAAQLTVQEIGTLAREGLDPVIILVNNHGYTVERAINGPKASYNDIAPWDWQAIPAAFGADAVLAQAATTGQLERELARLATHDGRIRLLEAALDRHDLPQLLEETAQAVARRNAR